MRLTLRTLLPWLDDTLAPEDAQRIGRQIEESPQAIRLVGRILRLVVSGGDLDLTVEDCDPNLVASYLSDRLEPQAVVEFEEMCLHGDGLLAEVASVHRMLSLIHDKVEVPPELRGRILGLVDEPR